MKMNRVLSTLTIGLGASLMLALPVLATPVLKASVTVSSAIVTVGDLFSGAELLAEKPLFRAPEPGTAGDVSLTAIRTAAARVGLAQFDNPGFLSVNVARAGTLVTAQMLRGSISNWLRTQGFISPQIGADVSFSQPLTRLYSADPANPVQIEDVRYDPNSGLFTARFGISGTKAPLVLSGRVQRMIEAPYLAQSVTAGAILSANDIEMRRVPLSLARNGELPDLAQLVGKQLKRPTRAGVLLTDSMVTEPQLVSRNEQIILVYKTGPLTLTARGRALNAAAKGGDVSVMNLVSNKVVTGTATSDGTVTIGLSATNS